MSNPVCCNCGQELRLELPPEPVWVGPGDKMIDKKTGYGFSIVGPDPRPSTGNADCIVERGPSEFMRLWFRNGEFFTLDGQPVAGFRDPRDVRIEELKQMVPTIDPVERDRYWLNMMCDKDERIRELEDERDQWRKTARRSAEDVAALVNEKLSHKCVANPLAGMSDEQLGRLAADRIMDSELLLGGQVHNETFRLLRDLRDGKLGVPR